MKIKKTVLCLLLCAALGAAALAAGGTEDPLVSLSYLAGTFGNTVDREIEQRLDASDAAISSGSSGSGSTANIASSWTEQRLKRGDCLTGSTGTSVLVLAGNVQVNVSSGTVVDVSAGTTVSSGATLSTGHRYMAAEDTSTNTTTTT